MTGDIKSRQSSDGAGSILVGSGASQQSLYGAAPCYGGCCGGRPSCGGLASDVSSIPESGQTTDIGCEGDISESDDCADWLREFEVALPCLPKFWLIMVVGERNVDTYFHCRLGYVRLSDGIYLVR